MKVGYLLGSLDRGGTETLLLDVFNQSTNSPFKIIGVYRKEGELTKSFRSSNVPLFKIEPGPVWLLWQYLWRLRHLLKSEKVDIVHAQQNLDTVYACLACLGLPVKVVQTFHGYDFHTGHLSKLLIRLSLKMAEINIFVSETQRKYFATNYNLNKHTSQVVVYNGINFGKLYSHSENSLRTEFGISDKSVLIGMVGNFVPVRDHMTVCRFLNLLRKKGVDFTFVFIGEKDDSNPQLFDDCQSFCENKSLIDKVLFLGSRSDVPALLPQLDAFVYSTNHDTFGIAVIEAIASGIPVFVNDWEVMEEITDKGTRATLYRTKDEKDLLDKFLSFLKLPEKYKNTTIENATWASKTYSIQNHMQRLYQLYQDNN